MTGGGSGGSVYKYVLARAGNGNVTSAAQKVVMSGTSEETNWSYGYEPLDRLLNSSDGGTKQFTYGYDRYGNRLNQLGGGGPTPQFLFDTKNQITLAGGFREPGDRRDVLW